jgi:DNA-binding PadR family transcriptional regulator
MYDQAAKAALAGLRINDQATKAALAGLRMYDQAAKAALPGLRINDQATKTALAGLRMYDQAAKTALAGLRINDQATKSALAGLRSALTEMNRQAMLVALADGDKHGYAIMKEVATRTDGEVRLSTGTLYGMVKRLLAEALLEESRRRPADDDDARRRYYRLTVFGRSVAQAEAKRLARALVGARAKRLLEGPA